MRHRLAHRVGRSSQATPAAVDKPQGASHTEFLTLPVEKVADLLHGKEKHVSAGSGYRGAASRVHRGGLQWHIAARPSDIAKQPEGRRKEAAKKREHRQASVRAKVEHPFRVIKRQFGLMKVRSAGWPRTRRTWSRCSHCRTCGWRAGS